MSGGHRGPLGDDFDAWTTKLRRSRGRHPAGHVDVGEMLPGPDGLWLRDSAQRRYTSEFRLVCVDRCASRSETRTER